MFLDSDDLLMLNCLDSRQKFFSMHPHLDFIVFPTEAFFKRIGYNASIWLPKSKNFLIRFLKHNLKWTIASPTWKKASFKKLNDFYEEYSRIQDVELHIRALLNQNFRFKALSNYSPDNFYRIDVSRTSIKTEVQLENFKNVIFMFIFKIFSILKQSKQKKALKVSLLTLMSIINHASVNNKISEKVHNKFEQDIKLYIKENDRIFNKNELQFLIIYNRIYFFLNFGV